MARAATRPPRRAGERETKRSPAPIAEIGQAGQFSGYASLFGLPDLGRDVVMPGAFADSLVERGAAGVRMLWQHEAGEPIGTWVSISEDPRGLKVVGRLNLAVARAREVHALMRGGAVDGLSIGFRTRMAVADRRAGVRRLLKLDLWEISVVTFPMLPQARVSAVKRANPAPDGERTPTALERSIRRAAEEFR